MLALPLGTRINELVIRPTRQLFPTRGGPPRALWAHHRASLSDRGPGKPFGSGRAAARMGHGLRNQELWSLKSDSKRRPALYEANRPNPHNPSLSRCVPMLPGPGAADLPGLDEVGLSGTRRGRAVGTESERNWPSLPALGMSTRGPDDERLLTPRDSYARLDRGSGSDRILGSLK